jgi:hypothetical protein
MPKIFAHGACDLDCRPDDGDPPATAAAMRP